MPYAPGDTVKAAGAGTYRGAQKQAFIEAFNACHERGVEEARCFRIAHAAARRAGDEEPMDDAVDEDEDE